MLLNEVKDALEKIDEHVYYGTTAPHPKGKPWDYIVFARDDLKRNKDKSGYADKFYVEIIREEFIEDGFPEKVIDALEALAGIRLAEGDHEYWYGFNPSTSMTVERLVLHFTRSRKL